jgi:hypothetical protein
MELTYSQVEEVGVAAQRSTRADRPARPKGGEHVIWVYEDGSVWHLVRDRHGFRSMRLARLDEIPQEGWRHAPECGCRYCRRPENRGRRPVLLPEPT